MQRKPMIIISVRDEHEDALDWLTSGASASTLWAVTR